ncbi:MAG: glucosyl-3-phosphoglycerate synthase, partial [Chloroflexi bacterium]|nr:glucosyl-3-phosphoglycerate synthase [Chloroflexota bacterium]
MAPFDDTVVVMASGRTRAAGRRVLVPLLTPSLAPALLDLGAALADGPGGQLQILSVVEVGESASFTRALPLARSYRAMLAASEAGRGRELSALVRVAPDVFSGIVEAVAETGANLVLLPWKGFTRRPDRVYGELTDRLLIAPPCDVLVARMIQPFEGRRVLVAVRGGPNSDLAVELGAQLTGGRGAGLTVLHATARGAESPDKHACVIRAAVARVAPLTRLVQAVGSAEQAILGEAAGQDLVIVGATGRPGEVSPIGPVAQRIARVTGRSLAIVKAGGQRVATGSRAPALLSERVDKWFAENTFSYREFSDIGRLVDLKRQRGLKIGLVLPTLNAAETIVGAIKAASGLLQQEFPLLDDIVVVDRGSTDGTPAIAKEHGARVERADAILPGVTSARGKGVALWKSLHVVQDDLLIWINPASRHHPRAMYGMVGALLSHPNLELVKGFYHQPAEDDDGQRRTGGGPVTELLIRPLLNLLVPDLSGLIQPLTAEFGGRRQILTSIPFFSGEAVETGILLDTYASVGLGRIAQVELGERTGLRRTPENATRAANSILQAVLQRLGERHHLELLEHANRSLKLIRQENGEYFLDIEEIDDRELPPLASIAPGTARAMGGGPRA